MRVRWRAAHSVRSTSYFILTRLRPGQINGYVDLIVADLGRIADRARDGEGWRRRGWSMEAEEFEKFGRKRKEAGSVANII